MDRFMEYTVIFSKQDEHAQTNQNEYIVALRVTRQQRKMTDSRLIWHGLATESNIKQKKLFCNGRVREGEAGHHLSPGGVLSATAGRLKEIRAVQTPSRRRWPGTTGSGGFDGSRGPRPAGERSRATFTRTDDGSVQSRGRSTTPAEVRAGTSGACLNPSRHSACRLQRGRRRETAQEVNLCGTDTPARSLSL
jgi:hypothetical protein